MCPLRALVFYSNRTTNTSDDRVFLTYKTDPPKPATRATFPGGSFWSSDALIKMHMKRKFFKTHPTCSISASWALYEGAGLAAILEAADWAGHTMFMQL